jgi:protein-disulfide isomerase
MKKTLLLALVLALFTVTRAQNSPEKTAQAAPASSDRSHPMLLPSKETVDAAMKRTLGYDPGVSWVIYDINPSAIADVADVLVSINKQQPQHIYMSMNTQDAIIGTMIPFGPNPFAPIRAKLEAADGPAQGAQNPAIVLVEFSDLECPHCKVAQPIVEKLLADFPQVRLIFQQFPLPASMHPWAMKAAEYADCAGRADKTRFWSYVDTIFTNQGSIASATADDQLKQFAGSAGLDGQKLANCAATIETEARVKKSLELGQALDVNQTPTVFINGRRVLGLADIPYDQLKNLVQFEIDHAGK